MKVDLTKTFEVAKKQFKGAEEGLVRQRAQQFKGAAPQDPEQQRRKSLTIIDAARRYSLEAEKLMHLKGGGMGLAEERLLQEREEKKRRLQELAEADAALTRRRQAEAQVDELEDGEHLFHYDDGSWYEGQIVSRVLCGTGVFHYADGSLYRGQFANGKMHGEGVFEYCKGDRYSGSWVDGLKHGVGKFLYGGSGDEGACDVYEGQFSMDVQHGEGLFTFADGSFHRGGYEDGCMSGHGEFVYADGNRYVGQWCLDQRQGMGTLLLRTGEWKGDRYEGEWYRNKKQGSGKYFHASGEIYDGQWKNDKQNGAGTLIWADGHQQSGIFRDGKIDPSATTAQ